MSLVGTLKTARGCGVTHAYMEYGNSIQDIENKLKIIFPSLDMIPQGEDDSQAFSFISEEEARPIIVDIFSKDLAYSSDLKSKPNADRLANLFIESVQSPTTRYFTGSNLTNATFDTGVLAIGSDIYGLIWVEDED